MEALKSFLGGLWVLMPFWFMGLAVVVVQCLLASLKYGEKNHTEIEEISQG